MRKIHELTAELNLQSGYRTAVFEFELEPAQWTQLAIGLFNRSNQPMIATWLLYDGVNPTNQPDNEIAGFTLQLPLEWQLEALYPEPMLTPGARTKETTGGPYRTGWHVVSAKPQTDPLALVNPFQTIPLLGAGRFRRAGVNNNQLYYDLVMDDRIYTTDPIQLLGYHAARVTVRVPVSMPKLTVQNAYDIATLGVFVSD